jgi:hypothetical protein
MTIETKYNIGDEVWFRGYKEIYKDKIFHIHANIDCDGKIRINYELWGDTIKEESKLFPTKEELLKSS